MTAPRQVLPGTTYLLTRRCAQRQFLLRPSSETNAIFLYVLALAAQRYGVQVHALCVLSNHFHLIVTDPHACLPAFAQYLGSLVARAANASLGRWESFWAPASYSAVALSAREDVVAKTVYVLANPVAAGLVPTGCEWPGLRTAPADLGTAYLRAVRPAVFFRRGGCLPESLELALTLPPGFHSAEEFRGEVSDALLDEERRLQEERRGSAGWLGARRVLAQRPSARPLPREERRTLNPRVAAQDKWKRMEALTRLRAFLKAYREAWAARRAGSASVVFPAGTYLLRVAHGVVCATPG